MKFGHKESETHGGPRAGHRAHSKPQALSLDKFAEAKTSTYNKKDVALKQRELKLRKLSKYKKLKRKLESESKLAPAIDLDTISARLASEDNLGDADDLFQRTAQPPNNDNAPKTSSQKPPKQKGRRQQSHANESKTAEQELEERLLLERAERQQKIKEAAKLRREKKSLYFKKTQRGQPVMKYRIDKILSALQTSKQ